MRITVLYGGPSAEREVSLVSGKAVIDGLVAMGHQVFPSDISPDDLSGLNHPADVIFPVLHGQFGESGELQEILEQRGLTFVGSGSRASRLGMDKAASKRAWKAAGLPTPDYRVLTSAAAEIDILPCVVKAIDSGSSIDVYICKTQDEARAALKTVIVNHGRAMVEQYVAGAELTVGILQEKALDPIRITTTRTFYDYQAKYQGNFTQYHFDLNLPEQTVRRVRELALRAHQIIGCRDLSRVDMMLDGQNQPWLIEINTLPGFTPKSLLPKAAAHGGIEFGALVDRLACAAYARARIAAAAA